MPVSRLRCTKCLDRHFASGGSGFADESPPPVLPQVVVPGTFADYTSRRVLTTEWLEGEKLSQSKADDVGTLVNVGVICYLKQVRPRSRKQLSLSN